MPHIVTKFHFSFDMLQTSRPVTWLVERSYSQW